eukprot:scaffold6899_cov183-Amphora_coffeaeformis.AAC.25
MSKVRPLLAFLPPAIADGTHTSSSFQLGIPRVLLQAPVYHSAFSGLITDDTFPQHEASSCSVDTD